MKAYGYCRVSTDSQAEDGVSLEAQRAKIIEYAKLYDYDLVAVEQDAGISGKSIKNRPGVIRAIEQAEASQGVLVIYSLSRLSRSTRDLIDIADRLRSAGCQLASVSEKFDTSTANGNLFYGIMSLLAEFERETIRERTQAAIDMKRGKGELTGNAPYGFMPVGSEGAKPILVPNAAELETLSRMLDLYAEGFNYSQIAKKLTEESRLNRVGGSWDRGSVRSIITQSLGGKHADLFAKFSLSMQASS